MPKSAAVFHVREIYQEKLSILVIFQHFWCILVIFSYFMYYIHESEIQDVFSR